MYDRAHDGDGVTVDALVEAIAKLSVDEVRALIAALQARLAIEPEDPWRWAVPAYGNPPFLWENDAYEAHTVRLTAVGPRRALVITQLRQVLGIALTEAKALADKAPCALGEFPDRERARSIAAVLEEAGATAEVRKKD